MPEAGSLKKLTFQYITLLNTQMARLIRPVCFHTHHGSPRKRYSRVTIGSYP